MKSDRFYGNREWPASLSRQTAQLPWLWEYKRKKRKIPKKEREKEKKEGFSDLLVYFLFVKISENHHKIYWLLYHFP